MTKITQIMIEILTSNSSQVLGWGELGFQQSVMTFQ